MSGGRRTTQLCSPKIFMNSAVTQKIPSGWCM